MGGRPSRGTPADKSLTENKPKPAAQTKATKAVMPIKPSK